MFRYLNTLAIIFLVMASTAFVPVRADIWEGDGRIISGPGEGGTTHLRVDYDGQNLRTFPGGPLLEGSMVRLEEQGERLDLTILRNNRIIRYQLRRVGPGSDEGSEKRGGGPKRLGEKLTKKQMAAAH
ncbi:MAG: hypothetical protein H7Y22_05255 [Gemmatimonadaceae bacterium]|nr:hypothetical protein [Gloeobacterales cyanobacterium ES-bin-141]